MHPPISSYLPSRSRYIRRLSTALAVVGALSACQMPTKASVTQPATLAFSNTCLESLPNFENFRGKARGASLRSSEDIGRIHSAYLVPGSSAFVRLMNLPGATDVDVCGLNVKNSQQLSNIGTEVLNAARSKVGTASEEKFSSKKFAYAIQLSNGSLLVQDTKDLGDIYSYVFLITQPVPRGRVPPLLNGE